jgi:GAF domain-containing protein
LSRKCVSPNLESDPNLSYPDWVEAGIHSCVGVPLVTQETLIGFIVMGYKTDIAEFEIRLLSAIGNAVVNAIRRAILLEQTQKDAANLALAYDSTLEGWAHALKLRD